MSGFAAICCPETLNHTHVSFQDLDFDLRPFHVSIVLSMRANTRCASLTLYARAKQHVFHVQVRVRYTFQGVFVRSLLKEHSYWLSDNMAIVRCTRTVAV